MLKIIRANTKALIWIFVALFVLWCIGSAITFGKEKNYVGKVGGRKISPQLYQEFYNIVFYSPKYNELLLSGTMLPDQFIPDTVFQYLVIYFQAKKENIRISDEEVRDEIQKRFSLQGIFRKDLYDQWIDRVYRGNSRNFEEGTRKELMIQAYLKNIRESLVLDEEEVKQQMIREKTEYSIEYFLFPLKSPKTSNPLPTELKRFYEDNKFIFKMPEQYDLTYLFLPIEKWLSQVDVSEEEIEKLYSQIEKNPANVIPPPPLEKIRSALETELKTRKAKRFAQEKAKEIEKNILKTKNFNSGEELAGSKAFRTGLKPADIIKKILGDAPNLTNTLSSMEINSLRTIHTALGSFVALLTNKEYSYIPSFEEAGETVLSQYQNKAQMTVTKEDAQKTLALVKENKMNFEQIAAQNNTSPKTFLLTSSAKNTNELGDVSYLFNQLQSTNEDYLEIWQTKKGVLLVHVLEKKVPNEQTIETDFKEYYEQRRDKERSLLLNQKLAELFQNAKIQNSLYQSSDPFSEIQ